MTKYFIQFMLYSLIFSLFSQTQAVEITIHKKDAVVWSQTQVIKGSVDTLLATTGTLFLNDQPFPLDINQSDYTFAVQIRLEEGTNRVYVLMDSSGYLFSSDTVYLDLGFRLRPELAATAEISGRQVTLKGQVLANPKEDNLTLLWQEDHRNPVLFQISAVKDSLATFSIPAGSPPGEYYFDFYTITDYADSIKARVCLVVDSIAVRAFDIKTDHAAWIDQAMIYQVTPYNFTANGNFNKVEQKIPELADLGINTLYIQPVYETYGGGQGYDIINYFRIRGDYGTESDLKNLISEAKRYGMHVLFDFVPGHSSIQHPYAQQTVKYGEDSHYYNYYKREFDQAPYSQHYNYHPDGFIYYFWRDLPMFDYDNPEVQRWMIEAARYWVEKYDIDGYRVDAVWGVNARNPEFSKKLRLVLKQLKPELFLLAEDKATWPSVFEESYDAAYDWTPEESWVSHWSWQYDYDPNGNPTIFNHPNQHQHAYMLKQALTNEGEGYHAGAIILRFLENNDTQRFIKHHGLARTKMAAALLYTLDGIPMIYNGQEIGFDIHPYETFNIFYSGSSITSLDEYGLFPWYKELLRLRKYHPALYSGNYAQIPVSPGSYMFAFRRWQGPENMFSVLNLGNFSTDADIDLPLTDIGLDSTTNYYLTDMLSGDVISGLPGEIMTITSHFEPYQAKLFLLADTLSIVNHLAGQRPVLPGVFHLSQNYPNPFNPQTTINYALPVSGRVKVEVYNLLGQKVVTLFEGNQTAGEHQIIFDGSQLASGIYIYRLQSEGRSVSRKMVLLR